MAHTASRARAAVTAIFFLNGMVFVSWYARLPAIQEKLDIGPGTLGLALLGAPAGMLVAQPLTGALAATIGSRRIVAVAPVLLLAALAPALAVSAPTLALATVLVGAANGALDVSMNVEGLAVERARRQADLQLAARGLLVRRPHGRCHRRPRRGSRARPTA